MRISDWSSEVCSSDLTAAPQQPAAAEQETGGLQDIVVTAQKRSESAQQVPIAISAVTSEALQAKGLTDVASISGQAPNVTLKSSGAFGGSSSTIFTYKNGRAHVCNPVTNAHLVWRLLLTTNKQKIQHKITKSDMNSKPYSTYLQYTT